MHVMNLQQNKKHQTAPLPDSPHHTSSRGQGLVRSSSMGRKCSVPALLKLYSVIPFNSYEIKFCRLSFVCCKTALMLPSTVVLPSPIDQIWTDFKEEKVPMESTFFLVRAKAKAKTVLKHKLPNDDYSSVATISRSVNKVSKKVDLKFYIFPKARISIFTRDV